MALGPQELQRYGGGGVTLCGGQQPGPGTYFSLTFTTRLGSSRRPGLWARSW